MYSKKTNVNTKKQYNNKKVPKYVKKNTSNHRHSIEYTIENKKQLHKVIQDTDFFKIIPKGSNAKLNFVLQWNSRRNVYENVCTIVIDSRNNDLQSMNMDCNFHTNLVQHRNINEYILNTSNTIVCSQFSGNYIKIKTEENTTKHLFVIDDVILYKGLPVYKKNLNEKIKLFYDFFKYNFENPKHCFTNNELYCAMCYFDRNIQNIYSIMNTRDFFDYTIYKILFILKDNSYFSLHYTHFNYIQMNTLKQREEKKCIIKGTIHFDIYKVFEYANNKDLGILHIPTYTTSVYLNTIFRNIRENMNIDYIEESEDEDEFEYDSISKHVNLNKSIIVDCVYNHSMKKYELKDLHTFECIEEN